MATVSMEKINKVYENGFHAVKDMDLDVADGEFMVLVGPSGCGKTTALRMVAGLEDITAGILRIGGKVVNDVAPQGPRHRHGVPELRPVPPHDGGREHRLFPEAAEGAQGPDQGEGQRGRQLLGLTD